jgi:hypothetical protein
LLARPGSRLARALKRERRPVDLRRHRRYLPVLLREPGASGRERPRREARGDLQAGTSLTLQFVKPNGRPVRVEAMVWRVDADGLGVFFLGTAPDGLMT